MRVIHIIKATRIGGAERHLLILLSALRARGVDAQLLMLVEPNNLMTEMIAEAEKRSIPAQRLVIGADWDISVIGRLRGAIRKLKPDIVHTHLIHADLFGLLAAKLSGVKVVLTGRHNDDSFRHHRVVRALNGLLWRGFSGGIAISESIRTFTMSIEDAPPDKVRVVTYGFEYTAPKPDELSLARKALLHELILPQEALIMGLACRLVEQKGVTYALQAFKRIYEEFPTAYLLVAGEGDLKAALEAEAQTLGIMPRMRWLGWRNDVPALLAGLDIFLVPSLWEGFGLVLLEAMSKRRAVIASAVSAIPEIVTHGETGLLAPPRDVDALADAMRLLLPDAALRAYMGLNGEDKLERYFSAARMADDTIRVYESFLTSSPRP
jgi:glycosyltransferase involved in cell wall biosynthesis